MPRFAANISMMYGEVDFLDRCEAAAADGFKAVECTFPYAWPAAALAGRLRAAGLPLVLLNAPPGDYGAGERGLACLPGRQAEFRDTIRRGLDYASALGVTRMHVMAGIAPPDVPAQTLAATYDENISWAAAMAASAGCAVMIEPINTRDMPGYFLSLQEAAHAHAERCTNAALGQRADARAAPCVQVQMDLYHCQIMQGDLETRLRRYVPTGRVGHIQIAGVPARNEPDTGEINYPHLFEVLDRIAYAGWVGCEYRPASSTRAGLGWLPAGFKA